MEPIYIVVDGGKVQAVYGTECHCPIIICDYDDAREGDEYAAEYCNKLDNLVKDKTVKELW